MRLWDIHKHNITPVIPEGLSRGVPNSTPTFHQLCFKSHVISGEPIAINRTQNPDSGTVTEKSLMEKPNKTLSDSGIEPGTPCSAVALGTTRPTRQSSQVVGYG